MDKIDREMLCFIGFVASVVIMTITLPSALCPSMRTVTIVVVNVGDENLDYSIYFVETFMWSGVVESGESVSHSWVKDYGPWHKIPFVVFLQTPNTIHQLDPVLGKNYFMVD